MASTPLQQLARRQARIMLLAAIPPLLTGVLAVLHHGHIVAEGLDSRSMLSPPLWAMAVFASLALAFTLAHLALRRSVLTPALETARAESDRLAISEARFRSVVDDQIEFISRFDPDFTITFINEAYARQLGRPRSAIIGTCLLDLMTPEQRQQFTSQLQQLTPEHPTVSYRMAGTRPDGTPSVEAWVDRALFDDAGRLLEYQSVGQDVTDEHRAADLLRDSEARFRAIAEGVPLPVVITAVDRSMILFANTQAREVFGINPGDPNFSYARVWVDVEQRKRVAEQITRDGAVDSVEVHMRRQDGTAFAAVLSARLMSYGGERAVLGAVVDITERRRMEEALRASEARLTGFMEHAPVGMHLKDREGRYVLANPETEKIFGRPPQEVIGLTPFDIFPCDEASMIDRNHHAVLESGESQVFEEYQPSLPQYTWAQMIRFPIRNADGEIEWIGSFALDITPQKRAEAELRASEARFRTIADLHPTPMTITRLADRALLFANRAFYSGFRLTPAMLTSFDRSRIFVDPNVRERIYATIARGESISGLEVALRDAEDNTFTAMLYARPIEYDGDRCCVISAQDVSELKAAEAEIRRQREALHQSEKLTALGSLLAGVAHELNNPLSVVVGYSSLLKDLAPDEATRQRADRVHVAAERCARIVKTFLAMARSKPPNYGMVRLEAVAEAALELAGYALRTADVQVERDWPVDLPEVWGDADQLHQVVTNLVVNAQQALLLIAPPRRLALRLRQQDESVVIEIEDNGPGMTTEVQQRLFEPFFTTKPQGVGTGVGLSVCHGIVGAHGGRIDVDSTLGQGTRFTVRLPIRPPAGTEMATGSPAMAAAGHRSGRVLIVDDEPEIADLVARALAGDGLEVVTARSGRVALERLRRERFDAIVSDLRMPDLDGPSLIAELQQHAPMLARRIVVITGDALGAELNTVVRDAGLPILEKPLDLVALRREVQHVLASA